MMERARIVEAMEELKRRRDYGDPVHEIIQDVAGQFDVSSDVLKERAETSWGVPLETDRERHADHFAFVDRKAEVSKRARTFARKVWALCRPAYERKKFLKRRCEEEFHRAMAQSDIEHLGLVNFAHQEFLDEISHLDDLETSNLNAAD